MISLEVRTRLSEEDAVKRIKEFFGKEGQGLMLTEEAPGCLSFQGGGGYVTAHLSAEGGGTMISLLTQEWEFQVKDFALRLPKSDW
jgi:hypothetical protein